MTELEVKQTCWAYLVEHGYPTTGRWSFYGGHWDHADPRKQYDDSTYAEDRKLLIAQIKRIGVNWEATQMPEFDVRSEFVGTGSPSSDTRTMMGLLVLNDGKMVKLGCHGQPEYLEDLAAHIERLTKDSERARSIFGVGTP